MLRSSAGGRCCASSTPSWSCCSGRTSVQGQNGPPPRLSLTCGLVSVCSGAAGCRDDSIFAPGPGSSLRLRDSVLFHMYVSSSPCGDARLNCPYESTAAREREHWCQSPWQPDGMSILWFSSSVITIIIILFMEHFLLVGKPHRAKRSKKSDQINQNPDQSQPGQNPAEPLVLS